MKKKLFLLVALPLAVACNNNEKKDSVEKADSANEAKRDTAANNSNTNAVVIDETSSNFLVKAANGGMTEVQLAELAKQNAASARVKDFSEMMIRDHTDAN